MALTNMVARFTDEDILKAYLDPDTNIVTVIMLDEDGEEISYNLDMSYPNMEYTIINDDALLIEKVSVPCYTPYGVQDLFFDIPPKSQIKVNGVYGTQDENTYVTSPTYWNDNATAVTSDPVNCVFMSPYIVLLDPTKNASITITVTG